MKRFVALAAVGFCLVQPLYADGIKLSNDATVSFATQEQARSLLAAEDEYIRRQGPFDRSARMQTDRAGTIVGTLCRLQNLSVVSRSAPRRES